MSNDIEEIKFPDHEKIIMECKTLMALKFPQYKNSWLKMEYEFGTQAWQRYNEFWKQRLMGEVEEFMKAENPQDAKKELCDIINICCMIHENTKWYRDPYWRYG